MVLLRRRRLIAVIGLAVAGTAVLRARAAQAQGSAALPAPPAEAGQLRVMSFNIRYGTANDGANHWTKRRDLLFDVLRSERPDLIGLQEALRFQIDEILTAVPGYAATGVGRDDGAAKGEFSAILFRADRFHVADSGTFWFSDTPEVPGSMSWGNRITRICSWARFVDRDGRVLAHYNVHLDHQSQPSREKSTALLRQRIDGRRRPGEPVIVSGDFNAGEQNPATRTLIGPFVDTFRVKHPDAKDVATFTSFTVPPPGGDKIDYILVEPGTDVLEAAIVRTSRDGRSPSDHFPVTAVIRLPAPASR
jgi:endonuclease/exonuclease/phosphatase family metal-dependent hydrolase